MRGWVLLNGISVKFVLLPEYDKSSFKVLTDVIIVFMTKRSDKCGKLGNEDLLAASAGKSVGRGAPGVEPEAMGCSNQFLVF